MVWFVLPAEAADPVVHRDQAESAVPLVAAAAKKPTSQFEAVDVVDLLQATPPYLVHGTTSRCTSTPATNAEIDALLRSIEGAINYFELDRGTSEVEKAAEALSCLVEPIDAARAARVYYLSGYLAALRKSDAAAEAAFRRALDFEPTLVWDENLPPDGRKLFETLKGSASYPFELTTRPIDLSLQVDGRDVIAKVRAGPHLVQGGTPLATVTVEVADDDVLVVPAAFEPTVLDWIGTEQEADLTALMARALPDRSTIYVSRADGVWMGVPSNGTWVPLGGGVPVPVVKPEKPVKERDSEGFRKGLVAVAAGGVLVGASAFVGIPAYVQGERVRAEASAGVHDLEELEEIQSRYAPYQKRLRAAWIAGGTGALLTGTGVALAYGVRW